MSGPLPTAIAQAASRAAVIAEQRASGLGWAEFMRRRARTYGKPATERDSLPGRTWADMHQGVRTALVMLSIDTAGEPRELARQPWDAFSDTDKAALAACARQFRHECRNAGCLW